MTKKTELVDLVDGLGIIQITGVPRTEIDTYPHLYLPIVIVVVLNSKGEMLVQKRALTKRVNPGDIDHICGGVMSGETPEVAAAREAFEETGVHPHNLRIVSQGINRYNRYRYLLAGESNDKPGDFDPMEVEWVQFIDPDELREKSNSGQFTFVEEFFEDTELACLT